MGRYTGVAILLDISRHVMLLSVRCVMLWCVTLCESGQVSQWGAGFTDTVLCNRWSIVQLIYHCDCYKTLIFSLFSPLLFLNRLNSSYFYFPLLCLCSVLFVFISSNYICYFASNFLSSAQSQSLSPSCHFPSHSFDLPFPSSIPSSPFCSIFI